MVIGDISIFDFSEAPSNPEWNVNRNLQKFSILTNPATNIEE